MTPFQSYPSSESVSEPERPVDTDIVSRDFARFIRLATYPVGIDPAWAAVYQRLHRLSN